MQILPETPDPSTSDSDPPRPVSRFRRLVGDPFDGACFGGCAGFFGGLIRGLSIAADQRYFEVGLTPLGVLTIGDQLHSWIPAGIGLGILLVLLVRLSRRLAQTLQQVIRIDVVDRYRLERWTYLSVAVLATVVVGWWVNRRFLPYRFAPTSLLADLLIVVVIPGVIYLLYKNAHRLSRVVNHRGPMRVLFATCLAAWLGISFNPVELGGAPRNVVLISVDTLRYDALAVNGADEPEISPNLDAFARISANFRNATSPSSWTLPSHTSLLTSLYNPDHGLDSPDARTKGVELAPEVLTLAEVLRNRGYRTHAITGGGFVHASYGLDHGFEAYYDHPRGLPQDISRLTTVLSDLRDEPFFVFFHTYEVHAPYLHGDYLDRVDGLSDLDTAEIRRATSDPVATSSPKAFGSYLEANDWKRPAVARALYDGGVHFFDEQFRRVVDRLEELDLLASTMVIVTSDHGEEFAEHNPGMIYDSHGHGLYQELVHIPLLIYHPDHQPSERTEPASLVDVAPTILSFLGIDPPRSMSGLDLFAAHSGEDPRIVFAETQLDPQAAKYAATDGRFKLIENGSCASLPCGQRLFLYDLAEDPLEREDLAMDLPAVVSTLEPRLDAYRATGSASTGGRDKNFDADPGLADQLRALGYIE